MERAFGTFKGIDKDRNNVYHCVKFKAFYCCVNYYPTNRLNAMLV